MSEAESRSTRFFDKFEEESSDGSWRAIHMSPMVADSGCSDVTANRLEAFTETSASNNMPESPVEFRSFHFQLRLLRSRTEDMCKQSCGRHVTSQQSPQISAVRPPQSQPDFRIRLFPRSTTARRRHRSQIQSKTIYRPPGTPVVMPP